MAAPRPPLPAKAAPSPGSHLAVAEAESTPTPTSSRSSATVAAQEHRPGAPAPLQAKDAILHGSPSSIKAAAPKSGRR
ncbi:unnamed protein product [Urochloa humidicola]